MTLKLIPLPPAPDVFIYSTQHRKLKPGEKCVESIAIMLDGDFVCHGILKTSPRPFEFQIRSSHNDRMWSNLPLHSDFLGTPDKPFLFPQPVRIPRASLVMVEITNLDTVRQKKDNVVSLQLIGISLRRNL